MNHHNELLLKVVDDLKAKNLGAVIRKTGKYIQEHSIGSLSDRFEEIERNYSLIRDYMLKGYKDTSREAMCAQLLASMWNMVCDIEKYQRFMETGVYAGAYRRSHRKYIQNDDVRRILEEYVQDYAMLSLGIESDKDERGAQLIKQHQETISCIFDNVLVSYQWRSDDCEFYTKLLLSPTIDVNDALVLISAITLSTINYFDFFKFKTLLNVFIKSSGEELRQRALVGWVMAIKDDICELFPVRKELERVMHSDDVMFELHELQKQIYFCAEAEKDNEEIAKEIMPNLMKNNNLRMTRLGIEEKEEDHLQDILHPDADEKNMEAVEKSFKQMLDMQKRGSDIYFGGFSQMKRFPFFNDLCNWFMPFYKEHPALREVYKKGSKIVDTLLGNGPFCDSDKYSLAIAIDTLIDKIPSDYREMMEGGQITPLASDLLEQDSAAFVRRIYLQNLYRFFRLHYDRAEFTDIFNVNTEGYGFFIGRISPYMYLEKCRQLLIGLARFFIKHGDYFHADEILDMIYSEDDIECIKLHVTVMLHLGNFDEAIKDIESVIEEHTGDEQLLNIAAEVYFKAGKPSIAAQLYQRLRENHPDSKKYLFNNAASLVEAGDIQNALPLLAELDFKYPDDVAIMRTRAWACLRQGKAIEAESLYNRIMKIGGIVSEDYLNLGYALWFQNDINAAVDMLCNYLMKNIEKIDLLTIFDRDRVILEENGIKKSDIFLMNDLVNNK